MRMMCGAVSGMFMVAGLMNGYSSPSDNEKKKAVYAMIQELAAQFKSENGSIICRELLGLKAPEGTHVPEKRTDEYYKKRPCPELIGDAAELLEAYMELMCYRYPELCYIAADILDKYLKNSGII